MEKELSKQHIPSLKKPSPLPWGGYAMKRKVRRIQRHTTATPCRYCLLSRNSYRQGLTVVSWLSLNVFFVVDASLLSWLSQLVAREHVTADGVT